MTEYFVILKYLLIFFSMWCIIFMVTFEQCLNVIHKKRSIGYEENL